MRIDSSTVAMESARSYRAVSTTMRRFTIRDYQEEETQKENALETAVDGNQGEKEAQKKEGQAEEKTGLAGDQAGQPAAVFQDWAGRMQKSQTVTVRSSASQTMADIRQATVRYIFDLLFSARRDRLSRWLNRGGVHETISPNESAAALSGTGTVQNAKNPKWTPEPFTTTLKVLTYSRDVINIEAEDTAFSTVGSVRTSDGREISFHVNVAMSRQFQQYYKEDFKLDTFRMCDPLVINLDTDIAELSDQNFYFDIDGDGELDEVAGLGAGSGYLALDKNGDGVINDGSELFGTASGNGFEDLRAYDQDGNGWIDENDAVWDKLKIWCKDENGRDVLYGLAEKGVGAICLKNVSTDFTLRGDGGRTKGAIRNSGVFLYENGNVGTVQHVDVAKYDFQA